MTEPDGTIRTVYASDEFNQFFHDADKRVQSKLKFVIDVIQRVYVIPTKYVKKLVECNLYEMRISVGYNEYRTILFAVDHENIIQSTKVILLNSFLKKSNKDYKAQIRIAEQIIKSMEYDTNR